MKPKNVAIVVGAAALVGGIIAESVTIASTPFPASRLIAGRVAGSGYTGMMGGATGSGYTGMMGGGADAGGVMGSLWANAPGEKAGPTGATRLRAARLYGAQIDPATGRIAFSGATAKFGMVVSHSALRSDGFEIAGSTNPAIVVPAGSRARIELVNGDGESAHVLVTSSGTAARSSMPMMTAGSTISGSALWLAGDATWSGMHLGHLGFMSNAPGSYKYFCPIPYHAQDGMMGSFVITG